MASLGVEAIAAFAEDGTKPETTEGKTFVDTGVELITDAAAGRRRVAGHGLRPARTAGADGSRPGRRVHRAGRASTRSSRTGRSPDGERPRPAASGGAVTTRVPQPDAGFDDRKSESLGLRVQHVLHAQPTLGPLAVLVLAIIAFSLLNERFLSAANLGPRARSRSR